VDFVKTTSLPWSGVLTGVSLANQLASTDNVTKTTNKHEHRIKNTQRQQDVPNKRRYK